MVTSSTPRRTPWTPGTTDLLRLLAPALVIVVIAVLEVLTGSHAVVLALVVVAPLLASSSLPAAGTAAYAGLALVAGAALGAYSDQYRSGQLGDQLVRLATIGIGGALAVSAARSRARRETRLAQVLRVAGAAQRAILPPVPHTLGPVLLAASYDSAAEEAAVGGDFYAAIGTPRGVRLLVGDVRGKGLGAVRLSSTVLGAFRERAEERDDLADLALDLDRAVARVGGEEDFVTAVLAEIRDGVLTLVNAGHPAPLLIRDGMAVSLAPTASCPPLGLGATPAVVPLALEPADRLLLYTDGVTEARRPRDRAFFPLEHFAAPCLGTGNLHEGLANLRGRLTEWTSGGLDDDATILAVQYTGPLSLDRAEAVVTDPGQRQEPAQQARG